MGNITEPAYKVVEVSLDQPITLKEQLVLELIAQLYPQEDFSIRIISPISLQMNLHAMNVEEFKVFLEQQLGDCVEEETGVFERLIGQIEAIKSYGVKGGKRLFVGYDQERKVKGRRQKAAQRGFLFYTGENSFSSCNASFPEQYTNQIICGDSEDVLKALPENSVDLVFTSPPYNFGLDYEQGEDWLHWKTYFEKLFHVLDECTRVTKYGGRIIINIQPLFSDYIPSHHIISEYLRSKKLIWKGEILWDKHNYNCKYTAWGSWKSPSSPYLKYTWEFLEVFAKGTLVKEGEKADIDITAEEFKKWVVARWAIAPERGMQRWGHPAMFPEELARRVIRLFSFKNDVVLDPFNGVGTTTVVAKKLSRRYLGIDVSHEYCLTATKRLTESENSP